MQSSPDTKSTPGFLTPAPWLFASVSLASVVLGIMVIASLVVHQPLGKFTRDVAVIAGVHPLAGVLSNLGILLWCATASICLFAASILRDASYPDRFRVLVVGGLFSAYLLCDDLFMIHDELVPHLLRIDEKVVISMIVVAAIGYTALLWRVLFQTNFMLFLVSVSMLAVSVVSDTIFEPQLEVLGDWNHLIEDGAKWIGIACWFSYHLHTALAWVAASREVTETAPAVAAAAATIAITRRPDPLPGMSHPVGSY